MSTLSRVGELARSHDPDRFFTTLFAPAAARPALWALYAFNHELVRAREAVREPMMAMIRLQWWREVVEGDAKRHEVATPLRQAIAAGALREADLLAMIDGREIELPETPGGPAGEWIGFVDATAGAVATAAAHALGTAELSLIRSAGCAYGAAGILRNRALAGSPPIVGMAEAGRDWLRRARAGHIPRTALAAALPAVYADRDLRRSAPIGVRGFGDKAAVVCAAVRGRL